MRRMVTVGAVLYAVVVAVVFFAAYVAEGLDS